MTFYHYTSNHHWNRFISIDGYLKTTDPTLSEDINKFPGNNVVWLTTNTNSRQGWWLSIDKDAKYEEETGCWIIIDKKTGQEYGVADKGRIRITVDVTPIKWTEWLKNFNLSKDDKMFMERLKKVSPEWVDFYVYPDIIMDDKWIEVIDLKTNTVLWDKVNTKKLKAL